MTKLLTKDEARCIANALCAMNVIGTPLFSTAIHRPVGRLRDKAETFLFCWRDLNDKDINEVFIHKTDMLGRNVRVTYRMDTIEVYANQNEFFNAYGLND